MDHSTSASPGWNACHANHNARSLAAVVDDLQAARELTLTRLAALQPADLGRCSRHPRLDQPMRVVDLLYFCAEHDDHHLARIRELIGA